MTELKFNVNKQSLKQSESNKYYNVIASNNKKYLILTFDFETEEWKDTATDTVDLNALFFIDDKAIRKVIGVDEGLAANQCYVPSEVIRSPYFELSVFAGHGTNDNYRVTTNKVKINVRDSGLEDFVEGNDCTLSDHYVKVVNKEEIEQLIHEVFNI